MFLFYGIKFSKLKFLIDIVAKFFTNYISINIVKRDITFSCLFESTNLQYLASTSRKKLVS